MYKWVNIVLDLFKIISFYNYSLQNLKMCYTVIMKKITSVYLILLLLSLCGCESEQTQTRFILDTAVTLTADCSQEVLNGAFELCEEYDRRFSRTNEKSEVYKLNESSGFVEIEDETKKLIEKSLYYSDVSGGRFDITVCSVSELWDFKNQIVPSRDEIAEALKNVDYEAIEINGNQVNLNGKRIDLGSIAKGYIADRVKGYFLENKVKKGIINLGGNVVVFGKDYTVGIQRPFGNDVIAVLNLRDKSAVTSGIYQRFIEKDGEFYHHILDTKTGYGVKNDLTSVTIIGDTSLDCDALSTVCLILGKKDGLKLIENTLGFEAVFIDKNEKITLSSGLYQKKDNIYLK